MISMDKPEDVHARAAQYNFKDYQEVIKVIYKAYTGNLRKDKKERERRARRKKEKENAKKGNR